MARAGPAAGARQCCAAQRRAGPYGVASAKAAKYDLS